MAMGGAIRTWSGLYWERALGAEAVVLDRGVHGFKNRRWKIISEGRQPREDSCMAKKQTGGSQAAFGGLSPTFAQMSNVGHSHG